MKYLVSVLLLIATAYIAIASLAWRQEQVIEAPLLGAIFDHGIHRKVGCADCHHNFTDGTGSGSCYMCHKQDEQLALSIEPDFHDFCADCHIKAAKEGHPEGVNLETELGHGPVRQCSGCHSATP